MQLLGKAQLVQTRHESGLTAKSLDLTPFGGPMIFLGLANSPLPVGTMDRGPLRVSFPALDVFQLAPGDPPPTIGGTGAAMGKLAKWLPIAGAVAAFFWFAGGMKNRRR